MNEELFTQGLAPVRELLQKKKISATELAKALFSQIEKKDAKVHAYLDVNKEKVLEDASVLEKNHSPQDLPLYGVPILLKDNICVEGELTRCASKILEGFRPPYDATVVKKLKEAGAIVCGRANMDEFAFGSSCENSAYATTHNPWDLTRAPGGSSGGSAAAVAAREALCALGSDTGGSIRQPASFCGVVGLKPTFGRVSRYGLIAFASSLDQIGPLTRTAEDSALLLRAIAGKDPYDATSCEIPVDDYHADLSKDIKGLKIGLPKECFVKGLDPEIRASLDAAMKVFEKQGCSVKEVSLPYTEYAVSVYYILATAEASSNLARFDGVKYGLREKSENVMDVYCKTRGKGFGDEAKRRIILGTYVLSRGYYEAYYVKAQRVRTLIKRDFEKAFGEGDCVAIPTSPTPAFKLKEKIDDPLAMYLSDIFTISINLAGVPAASIPCGFTKGGLPIGMQVITPAFQESLLLRVAHRYQKDTDWHTRAPSV